MRPKISSVELGPARRAEGSRIAVVLPSLRGGGVERVRLILAEEFLARGHGVDLVLMQVEGELLAEAPPACRIVDLKAPRLRQFWAALHRYLRRERPDAVLAAMWPHTGLACMAARTARVPARLVVSEHNDLRMAEAIKPWEHAILRTLGRLVYSSADAVVAVSRGVAESLQECAGLASETITVIHNPVRPPSRGQPPPGDAALLDWWSGGAAKLIAVGSLKRQKAFDVLLRALAGLRATLDARLIILGDGRLRSELEHLARMLDLGDAVRLPGFRDDPYPFLSAADLFVLSSAWEGFANVIVEALATGTPVVATDCRSGPAEILDDGRYGRLVPVGDERALAAAILAALGESHDRAALKARAAMFTPARAADQYLALLSPVGAAGTA